MARIYLATLQLPGLEGEHLASRTRQFHLLCQTPCTCKVKADLLIHLFIKSINKHSIEHIICMRHHAGPEHPEMKKHIHCLLSSKNLPTENSLNLTLCLVTTPRNKCPYWQSCLTLCSNLISISKKLMISLATRPLQMVFCLSGMFFPAVCLPHPANPYSAFESWLKHHFPKENFSSHPAWVRFPYSTSPLSFSVCDYTFIHMILKVYLYPPTRQ